VFVLIVELVAVTILANRAGRPSRAAADSTLRALRSSGIVFTGPEGARLVPLGGQPPLQLSRVPSGPPLDVGDHAVFLQAHSVMVLDTSPVTRLRDLTTGDALFPMVWPDTVGVVTRTRAGATTVSYEDVDGTPQAGGGWVIPAGYEPATQLLAWGPAGELTRWTPTGRSAEPGIPIGRAKAVVGQTSGQVAWASTDCAGNGECALVISPLEPPTPDGEDAPTVAPLPQHHGYLPTGAMSPDGRYLAAFVAAPDRSASLVVIDMAGYHVTVVPGGKVPVGSALPTARWNATGSIVIFSGGSGSMHAWMIGAGQAVTLPLPASDSFAVVD
jgi:hypothetical protein